MRRRKTASQKRAAKRNLVKARRKWRNMSRTARMKAMPGGRGSYRSRM